MLGISPLEWLAWLDFPQMVVVAQEKSAEWPPCTVPNSSYLAKVAVQTPLVFQMLGISPLESLAWLDSPQMAIVALKKVPNDPLRCP